MSTATHYIATDTGRSAIYGIGNTSQEAIADALSQCADLHGLIPIECSEALANEVEARGGAIDWDEIDDVGYLHGADGADLIDYYSAKYLRAATPAEAEASILAARGDGGAGVITVEGRSVYAE